MENLEYKNIIIKGVRYEHEYYGQVKVVGIETNTGDKKDRVLYIIYFKPDSAVDWSDPEKQGINGFIFQTKK